eukprot:15334024-Ditylum_brightwellii.AAC.1
MFPTLVPCSHHHHKDVEGIRRNVKAMLEIRAPRRRKMGLVVGRDCMSVSVRVKKAALPHVYFGVMRIAEFLHWVHLVECLCTETIVTKPQTQTMP